MNFKLKLYFLLTLVIALLKPAYAQTDSVDNNCIKCEEKMGQAIQNWKKTILNNNETEPISFIKLFKVDNEETKKLALTKLTADTTFFAYIRWHKNSEEIKFVRQGEVWGKKLTTVGAGMVGTGKLRTKKERIQVITDLLDKITYYYEVIYRDKETTVSVPALCLKTGIIESPVLSSSQFTNDNY